MNKRTANHLAEACYRRALTRGVYETSTRDYTAVYYPDCDSVVVSYTLEKTQHNEVYQHTCPVRKSWGQW